MRVPLTRAAVRLAIVALVASVVTLSACGSTAPRAVPIEETAFDTSLHVSLPAFRRLPSGVYVRDSIAGAGRAVVAGDSISVRYTGRFANGREFDHRRPPRAPLSFRLGRGTVIRGWEVGIPGMLLNGRRQLIIPPEMGYGSEDYLGIPANSVLVFTVDLVAIH